MDPVEYQILEPHVVNAIICIVLALVVFSFRSLWDAEEE